MTTTIFPLDGRKVWVAGHRGMVGRALVRQLQKHSCETLTTSEQRIDLRNQAEANSWVAKHRPDVIIVAAAKVGGIVANDTRPAEFLYDNLMIEANLIEAARQNHVTKILFLGSSCIYPRMAPQPMPENCLLTGPLEPTNQWYAIAKIAGIMLGQAYRRQYGLDVISGMPTNLYGPFDNFNLTSSHVVPALMRKIHEAKLAEKPDVEIWGTGKPLREFMHVDDCADALLHLLQHYSGEEHVNIGTGQEVSIGDLARLVAEVVGYTGKFVFNTSKPDGTPRKLQDCGKLLGMGWQPKISLKQGLESTYRWMLEHGLESTRH